MVQKGAVIFEVQKEDANGIRLYSFVVPLGAKYQEAYDVGNEILQGIVDLANKSVLQEPEEKPEECAQAQTDVVA